MLRRWRARFLRLWPPSRADWLIEQLHQERAELARRLLVAQFEGSNWERRYWQMKDRLEKQIAELADVHHAAP